MAAYWHEPAKKGQTRKPCPGCGSVYWRDADKVCANCAVLIKEALAAREKVKQETDADGYVNILIPRRFKLPWYNDYDRDVRNGIEQAFYDLALQLGRKTVSYSHPMPVLYGQELGYEDSHRSEVRNMEKSVVDLLKNLAVRTVAYASDCFNAGKRAGSSLLLNLAGGNVSVDDFNDESRKCGKLR